MRLLAHDALTAARRILGGIQTADTLARAGHDAQSRALLSELASLAASELPVIDGVLRAQAEAAEAVDFAQGARLHRAFCVSQPAEHPAAANDNHLPDPSSDLA